MFVVATNASRNALLGTPAPTASANDNDYLSTMVLLPTSLSPVMFDIEGAGGLGSPISFTARMGPNTAGSWVPESGSDTYGDAAPAQPSGTSLAVPSTFLAWMQVHGQHVIARGATPAPATEPCDAPETDAAAADDASIGLMAGLYDGVEPAGEALIETELVAGASGEWHNAPLGSVNPLFQDDESDNIASPFPVQPHMTPLGFAVPDDHHHHYAASGQFYPYQPAQQPPSQHHQQAEQQPQRGSHRFCQLSQVRTSSNGLGLSADGDHLDMFAPSALPALGEPATPHQHLQHLQQQHQQHQSLYMSMSPPLSPPSTASAPSSISSSTSTSLAGSPVVTPQMQRAFSMPQRTTSAPDALAFHDSSRAAASSYNIQVLPQVPSRHRPMPVTAASASTGADGLASGSGSRRSSNSGPSGDGAPRRQKLTPRQRKATCTHCGTQSTPAWRRDRDANLVCNACGIYQRQRGQMRPLTLVQQHQQQHNGAA